jgi:DDE superfamily endonuclease
VTCPARAGPGDCRSWSAARSSRWRAATHRGGCADSPTAAAALTKPGPRPRRRWSHWTLDALAEAARAQGSWSAAARSAGSCWPRGALAHGALLEPQRQPEVRPERAAIIALYTTPPEATIVICADELGPVIPRTFPPPPGWSTDGHRIKAPLDYARGPERTWVYGALRVRDGEAVTLTAPSRNSVGYQQLLAAVEQANPTGELAVITDNLASHSSFSTRAWLAEHPRIRQVFIPVGACWLNLQEAWWRLFRRAPLPGRASPARGDHPRHPGHDLPTQRPCPPLGLGPSTTLTTLPATRPHLPNLRNVAL